jgi:hypothetical protein
MAQLFTGVWNWLRVFVSGVVGRWSSWFHQSCSFLYFHCLLLNHACSDVDFTTNHTYGNGHFYTVLDKRAYPAFGSFAYCSASLRYLLTQEDAPCAICDTFPGELQSSYSCFLVFFLVVLSDTSGGGLGMELLLSVQLTAIYFDISIQ